MRCFSVCLSFRPFSYISMTCVTGDRTGRLDSTHTVPFGLPSRPPPDDNVIQAYPMWHTKACRARLSHKWRGRLVGWPPRSAAQGSRDLCTALPPAAVIAPHDGEFGRKTTRTVVACSAETPHRRQRRRWRRRPGEAGDRSGAQRRSRSGSKAVHGQSKGGDGRGQPAAGGKAVEGRRAHSRCAFEGRHT